MGSSVNPRSALRAATAADHERLDAAFAGFDLSSHEGYAAFLHAQAGALLAVERGVDDARPEPVLLDWSERRRSEMLLADLAELGVAAELYMEAPVFDGLDAALGAIYVLEGSRLGGRMLARSVPPNLPRRFLAAGAPERWRALIAVLDESLVTEERQAAAIGAARMVFRLFEASARSHLEVASRPKRPLSI